MSIKKFEPIFGCNTSLLLIYSLVKIGDPWRSLKTTTERMTARIRATTASTIMMISSTELSESVLSASSVSAGEGHWGSSLRKRMARGEMIPLQNITRKSQFRQSFVIKANSRGPDTRANIMQHKSSSRTCQRPRILHPCSCPQKGTQQ